jgi:hypothetical protein
LKINEIARVTNGLEHVKNDSEHVPNDLEHVPNDLEHVKNGLARVPNDLEHVKNDLAHVPNGLEHVKNDLAHVRNDLEHVPDRFAQAGFGKCAVDLGGAGQQKSPSCERQDELNRRIGCILRRRFSGKRKKPLVLFWRRLLKSCRGSYGARDVGVGAGLGGKIVLTHSNISRTAA